MYVYSYVIDFFLPWKNKLSIHVQSNLSTKVSHGNYKSGICWQVAFVRSVRNYYPMFTGRIWTGLCGQENATRRCPYAQVSWKDYLIIQWRRLADFASIDYLCLRKTCQTCQTIVNSIFCFLLTIVFFNHFGKILKI